VSRFVGPVDPSFRALSGRFKLTVRRHKFQPALMVGPNCQISDVGFTLTDPPKTGVCESQFIVFSTILAAENQLMRKSRKGRKSWSWSFREGCWSTKNLFVCAVAQVPRERGLLFQVSPPLPMAQGWST